MGNELSSDENRRSKNVSQAEVRRLLANQRREYERKCEEMMAQAVSATQAVEQPAPSYERNRTPYNYTRDDLHDIGRTTASLYPDLNQPTPSGTSGAHSFSFATNNSNSRPPHDFVFVKNPRNNSNRHMSPSAPPAPRERSHSRHRNRNAGGCEVNCPTCRSPYGSNIFQCGQGHSACSQCKINGRNCKLCGMALTDMRNFVLEEVVSQTKVSCTHANEGCKQRNRNVGGCEVNCPTCSSPYGSNIFQCGQGHSACSQCKINGRNCKLCGMVLTDMRNFVLEEVVSQTKVSCPHADEGCKLVLKASDVDNHIKECPFKEQKCPLNPQYANCVWRGKLKQMSNHFERCHRDQWQDRKGEEAPEMQLNNVFRKLHDVHLIVIGFFNFLLYLEVSEADRNIYMAVQLIGTKNSAEKWIYEIHVYNKNENRRKYTFTDNCSSNVESVEDIIKSRRCAVMPFARAETFVNNGIIAFKVFVKSINERMGAGNNQRGRGRN